MYRGVLISLTMLLMCMTQSCGGNSNKETGAATMLDSAKQMLNEGKCGAAIALLDSMNKKYPDDIASLRKGMYIRTLIQEKEIKMEMASNDSVMNNSEPYMASVADKFTYIDDPSLPEGYKIHKSLHSKPLIQRTGLEPRIDKNGNLYIVSLLYGKAINHTALRVVAGDGTSATTQTVPYDGSNNYHFQDGNNSCEMIHFSSSECEMLAQFVMNHENQPLKVVFVGKGNVGISMDNTLRTAIADSYKFTHFSKIAADAKARKIYLDEKLKIVKRQQEKTQIYS